MHELSLFLPLFVIDVFDDYFPTFVSKHSPVMTVNALSVNFVYDLLVPPSKCLSNPRILMVCESRDNFLVKRVVHEIIVFIVPHPFGRETKPGLKYQCRG